MVTCYDYTFARLLSGSAIDAILVGDSAAMVMHGHPSTLSMTIELTRLHTEAVVRGVAGKFVVADMPFLSFRMGQATAPDMPIFVRSSTRICPSHPAPAPIPIVGMFKNAVTSSAR